jgi:signal transduction histidine kinase
MTFQRKLLLGFSLMALPALLVGADAIRTNALERRTLQTLGENMARTRTYAELESAMSGQSEIIWRYLSGMDPTAQQEFTLNSQVIYYWQDRWKAALRPDEMGMATDVAEIQQQFQVVATRVFALYDSGQHQAAYRTARTELRDRLEPALTELTRDIYRRARESSVRGAYARLDSLVADEGRVLVVLLVLALGGAIAASRAFARMTQALHQSSEDMVRLNGELAGKVAQLERTQAQLVQSERLASIGEMSAAVAHGIRNPLASLRAAAQLALHRAESPDTREYLGTIIGEVDRLDRRVSHLLSFSRPAPFHPMQESVAQLIEDLLPVFSELLRERRVELTLAVAPTLPDVRVDPMQLEQALVEIISNALDAMPDGGRLRIEARAEQDADGLPGVLIEIADTGVGIPEHVLPTVCQPFITTRPEGTGLGLAVAKRFVEQNGGRLAIASEVGVGTTVHVRLPIP